MSTIIPSEAAYCGPSGTQKSLADTRITAASYTARVLADGGRIVSSAAVTSAFNFCTTNSISPKNLIFGASFGIREANGFVDKIYSFNGNDLVNFFPNDASFELFRLDETGTFPAFKMQSSFNRRTFGMMQCMNLQHLMEPGHTSWIAAGSGMSINANDGQSLVIISAHAPVGKGNAIIIEGFKNDSGLDKYRLQSPNGTYDPNSNVGGGIRYWDAGTPYTDWAGISMFVNYSARQVTTYNNGVIALGPANVDSQGFAWADGFDHSSALFQFLMGGQVSTGTYRSNNQKIAEAWHVSGGTTAQALALSQRLDTLYS